MAPRYGSNYLCNKLSFYGMAKYVRFSFSFSSILKSYQPFFSREGFLLVLDYAESAVTFDWEI